MQAAPVESLGADQPIAERLVDFAATFDYEAVPVDVRERPRHLILDATGIALARHHRDRVLALDRLRDVEELAQVLGRG